MALAEKMLDYRAKSNISQLKLAELVGTTQAQISRIEKGYPCRTVTERKILNVIERGAE